MTQLESVTQNAETFQAMKAVISAMSNIHATVGIDKVDDLMDVIHEKFENGNEINQAMAQVVDHLCTDTDELRAQLEVLGASDLEAKLIQPTNVPEMSLPTVPDFKLPSLKNGEAAKMKKLEADILVLVSMLLVLLYISSNECIRSNCNTAASETYCVQFLCMHQL